MSNVIIYTNLGNHCLKTNRSAQYRLWTTLRLMDTKGGSFVPAEKIIEAGEWLGLTPKRVSQIIAKGIGEFWRDAGDGGIRYFGKNKLVQIFNLPGLGDRVEIEYEHLLESLKLFKAALFTANYATRSWKEYKTGHMPVGEGRSFTRKKLRELTGINRITQYQYEELLGVDVEAQYIYAKPEELVINPVGDRLGTTHGVFSVDVDGDGEKELVWQTANRYTSKLKFAGKTPEVVSEVSRTSKKQSYAARKNLRVFSDTKNDDALFTAVYRPALPVTPRKGKYYALKW